MFNKAAYLILVALAITVVFFLQKVYPTVDLSRILSSLVAWGFSYLVFRVGIEGIASRHIKDSRTKYSLRKSMGILMYLVTGIIVLRIWVPNPQSLLIAYGLFAAGLALSLQDLFKNVAGAVVIFFSSVYRVGDRIEVGGRHGDVMDIGLLYTTLLELKEWVNGDQATGRIISIPNGQVLFMPVHNYTKDHNFLWDEIAIPITYTSDWKKAVTIIESITKVETAKVIKQAESDISRLEERYFFSKRNFEAKVYVELTDNWIMLSARYVVTSRERRDIKSLLMQLILIALQQEGDISIASQTMTLTTKSE